MKKILLMLALMLPCLGAWAQETETFVTPEAGKYYIIKGTHSTNPWLTATVENGGIDVATDRNSAGIYLKTTNGLLAVATGKYIGTGGNGSQISLVASEAQVTIEEIQNDTKVYIKTGGRYLYNNQSDYTREAGNLTAASADAPKWGFIEVTEGEYTINTSTGAFRGSGNDRSVWKYTRTLINPVELTLTSDANNMNSHDGLIQLHSGSNVSSTYTLTVPEGYTIISYSFDYAFGNSGTDVKKFVIGAEEYPVTAENQTLTVENINANSTQFVLSGNNQPVKMSNFIVKIQHPASEIIAQMKEVVIAEVESNSAKLKNALGYYSYTVNGEKVYDANNVKAAVNEAENAEDVITIKHSFALNTPQVGKYYRIKAYGSGKYLDAVNRYSGNQMGMKTEAERDFLGSIFLLDEGNRLKNLATETYIKDTYNIGADKNGANTWTFEASPRTLGCLLVKSNSNSPFLHDNNGAADRCSSDAGHATHDFVLEEVVLVNYILTDNAGNTYTAENVEGTIGVDPVFTGIPVVTLPNDPTKKLDGYLLENGSWTGNTFTATITFPFIVSSASQSNPMLIGQAFDSDKKMWTAVGGKVNAVDGIPSLGASQWMIYPSLNGTEFTFKIKSVSTEKYVTATTEGVTLTTVGTNFKCGRTDANGKSAFVWTCTNGDETLYVTLGSDDNNTPLGMTTDVANAGEKAFVAFQEFKSFKVTIGSAGYTTLYAPFMALTNDMQNNYQNLKDNNEVEIYTISDKATYNEATEQNMVHLTKMTSYIPQNGAAILKGNGTYVFTKLSQEMYETYLYDAEVEADWNANFLKGSSVNTLVGEASYVLSAPKDEVGLYQALMNMNAGGEKVGEENGGTHFLCNAGKAYILAEDLGIDKATGAVRFNFGGETTAIESVLNNGVDANAPIYDLSGRRVVNAVKGGIYIQNGKKFIVK